jgi:hypothetical protein
LLKFLSFILRSQLVVLSTKSHNEIVALYPAIGIVLARLTNVSIADALKTQYCLFLGNIAADCPECRKVLLQKGVFEAALRLLSETHLNAAAWIICNLTREVEGKERWNQLGKQVMHSPFSDLNLPYV